VAVPLSLLCAGLVLNDWVGYFPTVNEAWSQVSAGPLPDEVDADQLPALAGTGASMTAGRVVAVDIPATTSHFTHRTEYVYLPPAWFTTPRPQLPVVLMISGEFNTPADWIRVGDAVQNTNSPDDRLTSRGPWSVSCGRESIRARLIPPSARVSTIAAKSGSAVVRVGAKGTKAWQMTSRQTSNWSDAG
jgi:hypothetical protein